MLSNPEAPRAAPLPPTRTLASPYTYRGVGSARNDACGAESDRTAGSGSSLSILVVAARCMIVLGRFCEFSQPLSLPLDGSPPIKRHQPPMSNDLLNTVDFGPMEIIT